MSFILCNFPAMYHVLDIFFLVFHTTLIFFNLFGWIFKPLRRANLIVLLLTGGSWFILGIFYGIGYCPLTEWHWEVLQKLGQNRLPGSYITYLVERITGMIPNDKLVDVMTLILYFLALLASVFTNFFLRKHSRKAQ